MVIISYTTSKVQDFPLGTDTKRRPEGTGRLLVHLDLTSSGRGAGADGAALAVLAGALAVALVEQAVEVAGVLVADIGNDLLDVPVAAAQQTGGRLHSVLLEQLLVGAAGLRPDALADIGQRDAVAAGHIGKAGLAVILGDLIQSRLHQLGAADGHTVGFQREFLGVHRYPPLRRGPPGDKGMSEPGRAQVSQAPPLGGFCL